MEGAGNNRDGRTHVVARRESARGRRLGCRTASCTRSGPTAAIGESCFAMPGRHPGRRTGPDSLSSVARATTAFLSPSESTAAMSTRSHTFAGNRAGLENPVWSPDGKWIAFVGGEGAVMLVSPNGEERNAENCGQRVEPRLVSGCVKACLRDDRREGLQAGDRRLRPRYRAADYPALVKPSISAVAWSPDGKQLAFLSARPMPKSTVGGCGGEMPLDLWRMNADGSNPHRISKGNYSDLSWGTFQPVPTPSSQPEPKPSLQSQPKPTRQSEPKPSLQSGAEAERLQSGPQPKPSAGSGPDYGNSFHAQYPIERDEEPAEGPEDRRDRDHPASARQGADRRAWR